MTFSEKVESVLLRYKGFEMSCWRKMVATRSIEDEQSYWDRLSLDYHYLINNYMMSGYLDWELECLLWLLIKPVNKYKSSDSRQLVSEVPRTQLNCLNLAPFLFWDTAGLCLFWKWVVLLLTSFKQAVILLDIWCFHNSKLYGYIRLGLDSHFRLISTPRIQI